MSRVRESPLAIRLYVLGFLLFVWAPVPFNHGGAPLRIFISAFLLTLIPLVFLLRGSRVAWVVLLFLGVDAVIFNIAVGPRWPLPIELVLIALLLAPSSRAFTWRRTGQET